MNEQRQRRAWLLAIPALLVIAVLVGSMVLQFRSGVRVTVQNTGTRPLRLVVLHVTGASYGLDDIAVSDPKVRQQIADASENAHAAAVANNADEFTSALAAPNANWVYFRYLPPKDQIEAVHRANKRAFIAGPTVAGELPENWQHATGVGIDAILTDYPLELRTTIRKNASKE